MMDRNGETPELRFKWQSTASEPRASFAVVVDFIFLKKKKKAVKGTKI